MAMSDDSNRPPERKGLRVIDCLGFMYRREGSGLLGMHQVRFATRREPLSRLQSLIGTPAFRQDFGRNIQQLLQALLMATTEKYVERRVGFARSIDVEFLFVWNKNDFFAAGRTRQILPGLSRRQPRAWQRCPHELNHVIFGNLVCC